MRLATRTAVAVTAACGCLSSQVSVASEIITTPLVRPDPSSVTAPDTKAALSAKDSKDFDSHYYFFKQGVTYGKAFADLDQCRLYGLETTLTWAPPKFVPLGGEVVLEDEKGKLVSRSMLHGIIGGMIASWVIDIERDNYREATLRRCMAFKGYGRYGTSGDVWKQLEAGSEEQKFARLALIASGSQPQTEAIEP